MKYSLNIILLIPTPEVLRQLVYLNYQNGVRWKGQRCMHLYCCSLNIV